MAFISTIKPKYREITGDIDPFLKQNLPLNDLINKLKESEIDKNELFDDEFKKNFGKEIVDILMKSAVGGRRKTKRTKRRQNKRGKKSKKKITKKK